MNTPVPPLRNASTVILVRENRQAVEVYLLKRSTRSGFMDGLYVFPGGAVDPEDQGLSTWAPFMDLTPEQLNLRLGGPGIYGEDLLGFCVAALRETLEEAGVFIVSNPDGKNGPLEDICTLRLQHDLPKSWFRSQVREGGWQLALSSLYKWSHWITPKLMKKRFDTRFFMAFMPEGQICITDDTETHSGVWLTPREALDRNQALDVPLSPPTVVTLTQLLSFRTLADLEKELAARSWGDPISPRMIPTPNGPVILEPWDPMWDSDDPVDLTNLSEKVLAPGTGFSRIWCDNGIWKPVRP